MLRSPPRHALPCLLLPAWGEHFPGLLSTCFPPCPPLSHARFASTWAGGGNNVDILWVPLLTQACLACCKDQSQTPGATGTSRRGALVPWSPSGEAGGLWALGVLAKDAFCPPPPAPSSWPFEGSQQPALPSHLVLLLKELGAEPLLPGCSTSRASSPPPQTAVRAFAEPLLGASPSHSGERSVSPHLRPASGGGQ